MFKKTIICCGILIALIQMVIAQNNPPKWSLQQCVEYAIKNNISVRQADVQLRVAQLTSKQAILAQYPTFNFSTNGSYQFGRSIDPATNQFTSTQIFGSSTGLSSNVELFNWFRQKNTADAAALQAEASFAIKEKAQNDIALNVANAYLQILLNAEQVNVSKVQVSQSIEQVNTVDKQVQAGALPELNLAEMQVQLANDSSTLINAETNYILSLLQLKAVLTLPADTAFEVEIPNVDDIPVESLGSLDPALVYQSAISLLPQQKINNLNLLIAEKNALIAKSGMYPSIGLFAGLDSRYSSFSKNSLIDQLNNNFGQSAGASIRVPIFNGASARTNWNKAKLDIENVNLQKRQDELTLKQDIYQAHANAVAALQRYNAAIKGEATAQNAYNFAAKRLEVGLLNSFDLINNQNNLFRAKINLISAQFDYVFKIKLLEFYKGQGIKL